MSSAVTTVNSSQGTPGWKSTPRIVPRGEELRTVVPNSMPGIVRSSTYLACPVTFRRPSLRGRDRPMADIRRGLCHGPRHFTSDSLQSRLRHARDTDRRAGAAHSPGDPAAGTRGVRCVDRSTARDPGRTAAVAERTLHVARAARRQRLRALEARGWRARAAAPPQAHLRGAAAGHRRAAHVPAGPETHVAR